MILIALYLLVIMWRLDHAETGSCFEDSDELIRGEGRELVRRAAPLQRSAAVTSVIPA